MQICTECWHYINLKCNGHKRDEKHCDMYLAQKEVEEMYRIEKKGWWRMDCLRNETYLIFCIRWTPYHLARCYARSAVRLISLEKIKSDEFIIKA